MLRATAIGFMAGVLMAAPAAAQHDHAGGPPSDIRALTIEQVHGYMTGEGMGMALAAELNRYPGPKHVLELADSLRITSDQRQRVERIRQAMLARAVELGPRIVALERELDALFEDGSATVDAVADLTGRISALQGQLRAAHLAAHIETRALLSPEQIREYDRLRGNHEGDGGAARREPTSTRTGAPPSD